MITPAGIELVQSFLIVAEHLSFRRGAERLNLDQSALTRRIQKLEHFLGFRLLDRSTREVVLTAAGQSFYRENAHLLSRYHASIDTARRISEGKAGVLRVAYMAFAATELMPRTVSRFRAEHPHVEVRLKYIRTQGQKLALANDEIDLGFMIGPFDHPEYDSLHLTSEVLYVVMPHDHPLTHKDTLVPADLNGHPLILGDEREWAEFRWRLNDLFNAEGVALNPTLEASNTLALIGLVAAGLGITVCPESLVGHLGRDITVRPIVHPSFRSNTILTSRRGNRSAVVASFIAAAKAALPEPQAEA